MKKIISILLLAAVASLSLSAQETEEKQYLPEAGDWSIGFDVKPVFKYVGGLFNNYNQQSTLENFPAGQPSIYKPVENHEDFEDYQYYPTASIMGRYMLTDKLAVKANVGIVLENDKSGAYVSDDAATILDPLSQSKVGDYENTRTTGFSLQAGVEYRLGKKRIQGVFGGGILFGLQNCKKVYTYGNEMTLINQMPTSSYQYNEGYRLLRSFSKQPDYFAGLYGSAGVEFFVAPKVALGAEMSLCAGYSIKQQKFTVSEGYNRSTEVIETKTDLVEPLTSGFQLSTRNLGGSLYLAFYF